MSRTVRYIFSTFGTNIVVGGSGFVISLILARVLGPTGKGQITAIILLPMVLSALFAFGFMQGNVYQGAKNPKETSKLITNSIFMVIAVAPLALIAGWYSLPLFLHTRNATTLIAGRVALLAIPLLLFQGFINGLLRGWQKIDQFNLVTIIRKLTFLLFLAALVLFFNTSLTLIALTWIIAISLSSFLAFGFALKGNSYKFLGDKRLIYKTISYGLKSYLGSLSSWGNLRIDQLLIAALFTASSLGIYSVAVTMSESLWLAAFAVAAVVFPVASGLTESEADKLTAKASRVTFSLLMAVAVPLFILAPQVTILLFGKQFQRSALLLRILLPGTVAFGVGKVLTSGLMGTNQPFKFSIAQMVALISTIIFAPPLIFFYGAIGAAVASNIAYGLFLITGIYYFLKSSRLSLREISLVGKSDLLALKDTVRSLARTR